MVIKHSNSTFSLADPVQIFLGKMVKRTCFAPNCRSRLKKGGTETVNTFTCRGSDAVFKEWQRNIPRKDKVFTRKHCVCQEHFLPGDIIRHNEFLINGEVVTLPRTMPLLKKDAVPCIWPLSKCIHKFVSFELFLTVAKQFLIFKNLDCPTNLTKVPKPRKPLIAKKSKKDPLELIQSTVESVHEADREESADFNENEAIVDPLFLVKQKQPPLPIILINTSKMYICCFTDRI